MLVLSVVYFFFIGLILVALSLKRARGLYRLMMIVMKIEGPSYWDLATKHAKELMGEDQISYLSKLCVQYGYRPWALFTSNFNFVVIVSHPNSVADVIQNPHMSDMSSWLDNGLRYCVAEGSLNLNRPYPTGQWPRRVISPAFKKPNMNTRMVAMCAGAEDLVEQLRVKADGPSFDVTDILDISIVDTTIRFIADNVKVITSVRRSCEAVEEGMLPARIETLNPFYHSFKAKFDKKTREKDEFTRSVISEMKPLFRKEKIIVKNCMINRMDPQPEDDVECLSSAILELGIDEQDVGDEFLTIAVGAMETCRTVLKTMMLLVALHSDVQHRLYEELETALGQMKSLTLQDLQDMKYMDAVIKESLRLYPSVPLVGRNVDKTSTISGVVVPRGSHVIINTMALQRNPDVFVDPNSFIPERFMGEGEKNLHQYAYMPFSVDQITCSGQGDITLKVFFSAILRNFRIVPGENIKCVDDIEIRIGSAISICDPKIRLVSRNKTVFV